MLATVFDNKELDHELGDAAARMVALRVTADDLDRERPRLLEEVSNMYEGFPALAAMNNARELVRPTPGGGRRGGRPEYLRAIALEEVRARLDRYYKPRNAILALAGDFDAAAARRAIESHFAALPAGEEIGPPREPGAPKYFMPVRQKAVRAAESTGEPMACLAYLAPRPGTELYAPFLVLVARLWAGEARLGGSGATGSPVYFPPLDDGSVVAISAPIRRGETPARAFERIEKFVASTIEPKLGARERDAAKQRFMILGLGDMPDVVLGQNPYGEAFSLARRDQLGLDAARLGRALDAVTDQDLRRVAAEVFTPGRHAGALAGLGGPDE